MQIRLRLTLYYMIITATLLLVALVSIYWISNFERKLAFEKNLQFKGISRVKLLVSFLDVSTLYQVDRSRKELFDKHTVTIYDHQFKVLYDNNKEINFMKIYPNLNKQLANLKKGEVMRLSSGEMEIVAIAVRYKNFNGYMISGGIDTYGHRRIAQLKNNLVFIYFSILLAVGYAGWIFAGQALKPVSQMIQQVELITDKDLKTRIDTGNGIDEIAKLAKTFNQMMDRIEMAFALQKGFISNASHEIGNPLAAITTQIDVALLKDREINDYKALLYSIQEDVERLNKLTKQLLLLGRTEYSQAVQQFKKIDPTEIMQVLVESFRQRYPDTHITFYQSHQSGNISGNYDLIYAVFYNLLDNAVKFSNDKMVTINMAHTKSVVQIQFQNQGPELTQDDIKRIFQPFFRATSSREAISGHGLGMSIVANILEIHRGKINVHSVNGKTSVTVLLPLIF